MLTVDVSTLNAQAEVVRTASANGAVILRTSTGVQLASVPLGATPFSPASGGSTSLTANHTAVATASGSATHFELRRSDDSLILTGSVGLGVGDLRLTDTLVNAGDTVSLDALTYVAPGA